MNSITAAKDISGLTPVGVLKGITPMCVPYVPEAGIAEEVRHRAAPNIVSLWKRLGLVYFSEQPAAAPVNRTNVTVNNFTAQLVFRVCSQNHTDRLIERYQPGFVFPEKIRLAGMGRNSSIRRNELRRMEELFSTNSRYTEEVSRIFRLVFEKETGGIPLQTVCRALAFLLGSTGGGAVFTAQQQRIFQRIATVLSAEYPESTAAQEVASVGAAAVFTEEQRRRILSAANVMGYRSQHDAAQRVLSLVNSGKTREEIGRVLLTEVRRYGLDENSSTADTRVTSAYAPYTVRPTSDQQDEVRPGTVLPVNDVVHEIGAILYSQESSAGSPAENITSEILNGSSLIRTISDRVSSVISSERHSVSEYTDLVSRQILSYIQGHNVYPDNLKSNSVGTFPAVGLIPLRSENSSKFISVTAGTASRIIRQLSGFQQESPHTLLTNNIENSTAGNNFSETLAVMQKFSAKESISHETERSFSGASPDGSQSYVVNPQFSVYNDFSEPETVQVVRSAEAVRSTEKVVEKNESTAKNTTILSSGQTTELHNMERLHTHSDSTELRTDADVKPGTVLPPEQVTEFHNTERLHTHSDSTELRTDADVKSGTVLPPEQVTEFHNTERIHTENNTLRTQEISSYRSRLDARTLETLDRLVSESRSGSESKSKIAEEPAQLIHSGKTTPDTVSEAVNRTAQELRSVSIVRRSIVSETSLHIKKLMETAARSVTPEPAGKQAFTFRTAESGGNMVMLIPPAEADRYSASRPYNGKMPPIELKQPPEPQTERESSARKTTVNNRTVVKTVDNALDALSREDITRLADRVYERIENRLTRERRRMGM